MLDRPFKPSHLYLQVRNELARRIAIGEYKSGATIPNEFALANQLQVSVGTIRKAMDVLVSEKLVIRAQGRGTTIADRDSADYRGQFDRIRNADGSSICWHYREIEREIRAPTAIEQFKLRLRASDSLVAIRRVRYADGVPAKSEYVRLPLAAFPAIAGLRVNETLIESLGVAAGLILGSADETIAIGAGGEDDDPVLDVAANAPIVRLERVVSDGDGHPVEWRVAACDLTGRRYHAPSAIVSRH